MVLTAGRAWAAWWAVVPRRAEAVCDVVLAVVEGDGVLRAGVGGVSCGLGVLCVSFWF